MAKDTNLVIIKGAKGKGGGGATFEADDNMFARQSAAFIDAIAEGPIKGLVYGDASILVDEVRLRNVNVATGRIDQATNFNNFTVLTKNGDAQQIVDAEFFAEYPTASFMQSVGGAELLEGESQFHTISSGTFEKNQTDYIKITISTTGMSAITKTGDNKGDINTTKVFFTIDFSWTDIDGVQRTVEVFDTGFDGKVSGKYAHTFGFNIEPYKSLVSPYNGLTDWALKITKLTSSPESTDSVEVQNAIFVDSIEASIADKLEYPYTAYVGGVIDAEAFSSIPARGYEIDGKLIQIPSNHLPIDYNGRKVTLSNASAFAVGDQISQTLAISSITSAGTAEEGYTATATVAAHGVATGETFSTTIATTATQDEDFFEGNFVCVAASATTFTYTLNKPFDTAADSGKGAYKTITSNTCTGTMTAAMFAGGVVDKKVSNTLYLRNVAANTSALTGPIANTDGDTGTITSTAQVLIPANYRRRNSDGKVMTNEQDWDGEFYQSWCNNPAWVYNDLVTNKIYGLGNYLSQIQVNKWELFQIGRYCDELVPAGLEALDLLSIHCTDDTNYLDSGSSGQHEPRFSANLVISGKQEAFKVLNDVTSMFRGMQYYLNGEAYIVQDSEKDPVYQFTNANVINGEFKYEGTANKTRTNSITVNWNNPQDYYRTRTEIVELEEVLQKDGEYVKAESTTAFGCTSRGQARRLGKWKLLTNNWNTNTVTFDTSINAAFLRPGDIVQVIDQNKDGKSWGGRVSSSSSTSAINVDRKPTSFGDTGVESGYAVADYNLTVSFVGYRCLLAQDQATIGGTAYIRGDVIPSITTEEAAARIQDDSNDLVFTQWIPFVYTEKQTLSGVSNSGKTLTVASAFDLAPTQDAVWIISRSALATGKTKKEAKLFRLISMLETDRATYQITALEYNASKFDAIDKNEALTQYRTIYLPDSFKDVPSVLNIDVQPSIRAGGVDGGNINVLTVDWDPAMNSDGSLYNSIRHYRVEYSKDNEKWLHAGNTANTDLEIKDDALSGTYYFRVYTVNLNGKRSPFAASGALVVDFNRAVGPSEGTVGNDSYTINKIGNVSGDFTLNSGKVTFSPVNLFHNDGKNEHAVSNQAQLDFTGLTGSNTNNNGANTGYVYFDHSASAFKAISHDETSDQFYVTGASIFATATGTLTAEFFGKAKSWIGLDSTNFDGELAVDNMFKYTKSSVDYYHRVKRFVSDSVMVSVSATRHTLIDADNQAFSKPNFLVDYKNDTIMGSVVKDGSGNYTMQKYGASQGESPFEVHGSNENFTFDANLDGTVTNESAFECNFTVKKGSQAYAFAASGTTLNTFGISLQARVGFDNDSDIVIASDGGVTIGDTDMDAHTGASATLRLFDRGRANLLIADKILSFTKTSQGSAGDNAKIVVVTPSNQFFYKFFFAEGEDSGGSNGVFNEITPSHITIKAATDNTTADGVWSTSAGTLTNIVNTHGAPSCRVTAANSVDGMTVTYTLASADGSSADSTTLEVLDSMGNQITPFLTNEAHVYPAATNGAVSDITGSGTDVQVFEGGTLLDYDGTGTARGKWKLVLSSPSGLTKGSVGSQGSTPSRFARVANHTPATGTDNYSLVYSITGKTSQNKAFSFEKVQTLTKSKTGDDGSNGISVKTETLFQKGSSAPSYSATAGTYADPDNGNGSWSYTMATLANGEKMWAITRSFNSDNSSTANWTAPVNILTRTNGTNATALTITNTQVNTPSAGRTTITFSDGSSFIIDNGTNGTDGDGVDVIYQNSASAITSAPSASSGAPSGWSFTASAPSAGSLTYVSFGVRTNNTGNYTWSIPSVITAVSAITETIFRLNSATISATSGTYANPLAGNGDWSLAMPALSTNGHIAYASTRTFYSDGRSTTNWTNPIAALTRTNGTNATALTISNTQANTPSTGRTTITFSDGSSFIIDNGTNGSDGDGVDIVYRVAATGFSETPSASSGAPSNWSFTVPSEPSGNNRIYVSFGVRSNNTGNYTWTASRILSGADGDDGDPGAAGDSSSVVYYLQTGYNVPSKPTQNANPPSGWSLTIPSAAAGKSIWASQGNKASGGSWVWGDPFFYFEFTGFEGAFEANFSQFDLSAAGLGALNLADNTYNNSQVTNSLVWGTITVSSGNQATSWSTADQSTYIPSASTQVGTLSITHPTIGNFNATFTWTRSGTNVSAFALSNVGSGNDAWTSSSFGSNAVLKSITVTHTASSRTIALTASVIDLSGVGGCLVTGSKITVPVYNDVVSIPIEDIEIGQKVLAYNEETGEEVEAYVEGKASHGAERYYKVNSLQLTAGHPIWANERWTCVEPVEYARECEAYGHTLDLEPEKLELGDILYGGAIVETIELIDESALVWNIMIEDVHTYIADDILVHNGGGGGGGYKCLTPAMLPENLQVGDMIDSPLGETKVVNIVHKEREGYYILEDELEITNDHPILIDGEWILAEEYVGKKEYIDTPTEVIYVETENELLTVKGWTVGGKY